MENTSVSITAPAKVNLYLEITGVLDNGFHELDTLFIPLTEPYDTMEMSLESGSGIGCVLECSIPELEGEGNLIAKAWSRFGEATGYRPDIRVRLTKRIPMGAGLGGGSTDCAAMLRFLNDHAGEKALEEDELRRMAAGLGADVPFFLLGEPAWAKGIGDELEPVSLDLEGSALVVVCPRAHVSTPWAYRSWDERHPSGLPEEKFDPIGDAKSPSLSLTSASGATMKSDSPERLALYNAFEEVVFPAFPGLRVIKEKLLKAGACGAVMSGSGASVLGLFRDVERARTATDRFMQSGVAAFLNIL